jgi:hypothetical protein
MPGSQQRDNHNYFTTGEDFSIFYETVLKLLEAVAELRGDPDLDATNEGGTVVWLK